MQEQVRNKVDKPPAKPAPQPQAETPAEPKPNPVRDEVFGKLAWLFILLPGFLFTAVVDFVAELPELSEFQQTGFSLIASMACALLAWPLAWLVSKAFHLASRSYRHQVSLPLFFSVAFLTAPLLGLYYGQAVQDGTLLKLIGHTPGIKLLDKASSKRPLIYLLSRNNRGEMRDESADGRDGSQRRTNSFARFRLKDGGLSYEGWPLYFAHGSKQAEIYVSPACRIDEKGVATVLPGPGVVIMETELQAVEFLDKAESACEQAIQRKLAASAAR